MKLILASAGLYTPEIVATCADMVGKPKSDINVAVINEAYAVEHGDHGWVLDDLERIKSSFGGNMELVNLMALDLPTVRRRIEKADVIYVVGGHTDYLMSVFEKTGFGQLLPELLATKVYVGSSAGSMVFGQRISADAYQKVYGEAASYGVTHYLELVDFAVKPHLGSQLFANSREEMLLEVTQDFVGTVYGLHDDSAVVIDGETMTMIGTPPFKIVDGKSVQ